MKKSIGSKVARAIELRIHGEFFRIERTTKNNKYFTWAFTEEPTMKTSVKPRFVVDSPPEHTIGPQMVDLEAQGAFSLIDEIHPIPALDLTTDIYLPEQSPYGFSVNPLIDSDLFNY